LLLVLPAKVFSAGMDSQECQPIYGGGQTCVQAPEISLNKEVKHPASDEYVDNLGVSDPKYSPGQSVTFKLTVKNTSDKSLSNVKVTDTFPQFVDFREGSGSFDSKSRTFNFTIDKLNANEAKVFFIGGRVVAKDKLPSDQATVCVVNQAAASVNSKTSQDNSQLCIEKEKIAATTPPNQSNPPTTKGGLPLYPPAQTKKTPETGPEMLSIIGLAPTGLFGYLLKRKLR